MTPATIVYRVMRGFDVDHADMVSHSHDPKAVAARWVAVYLLRRHTTLTPEQIGQAFGRRHQNRKYVYDSLLKFEAAYGDDGYLTTMASNGRDIRVYVKGVIDEVDALFTREAVTP